MAINEIYPGYIGLATVDGQRVRCNDFNVNPVQEPLFYDHTIGLRDSIPETIFEGKSDAGELNPQKIIWRPSVKIYQGSISYPLTDELGADPLFALARTGDDFNMTFVYTCNKIARQFTGCKVNSYTFSITAGDFATVQADIMALRMEDVGGSTDYTKEEKIVTWDDVEISGSFGSIPIQSFSVTINNNCMPIYTAGVNVSKELNPGKIRVGMQQVTGTISFYNKGLSLSFMESIIGPTSIEVKTSDGFEMEINCIFRPQERTASVSPIISALPFVGVDKALG